MYYVCWGWGGGVGNRLGIYKKGGKGKVCGALKKLTGYGSTIPCVPFGNRIAQIIDQIIDRIVFLFWQICLIHYSFFNFYIFCIYWSQST